MDNNNNLYGQYPGTPYPMPYTPPHPVAKVKEKPEYSKGELILSAFVFIAAFFFVRFVVFHATGFITTGLFTAIITAAIIYLRKKECKFSRFNKVLTGIRDTNIPIFRNLDTEFIKSLHSERKIPVNIVLKETSDGFELSYTPIDGRLTPLTGIVGKGLSFEPARDTEKALATIRTQLAKLGDTPYIARDVHVESKPWFIPISVLNQWRRETLKVL